MPRRQTIALVLAAAALACAGLGVLRGVDADDAPRDGVRLVYELDVMHLVDHERGRALDRTVRVIRERVGGGGGGAERAFDVAVNESAEGYRVVVEVTGQIHSEILDALRGLIARGARLELQLVRFGSSALSRIVAATKADPGPAATLGITPEVEPWEGPDGVTRLDFYLWAGDRHEHLDELEAKRIGCSAPPMDGKRYCSVSGRVVLDRYLTAFAAMHPDMRPTPPEWFAYEYIASTSDKPAHWRTYLLEGVVRVDGTAIADASMTYDPSTGSPVVMVQLDADAAAAFAELTRENTGSHLAIVIDGRVESAPVIRDAIPGGRIQIDPGGVDLDERRRDAQALAAALEAGSLPTPMFLAHEERFVVPPTGFLAAAWMYLAAAAAVLAVLGAYLFATRPKPQGT